VVLSYAGDNRKLAHHLRLELANLATLRNTKITEEIANKLAENGKKIMERVAEELDEHTVESINITDVRKPLKCSHFVDSAEDSD
jgi:histidinol dehydrogenase